MADFLREWNDDEFPLAYLITFRTYGSWLHGDKRRSVDTHDDLNIYGSIDRDPNPNLEAKMRRNMPQKAILLNRQQRGIIKEAIKRECEFRGFRLFAINVRSNHVHAVISAVVSPEYVSNFLKRYSTRALREAGLHSDDQKLWARGRSRKYLWREDELTRAINYVLYEQGDPRMD